MFYQFYGYLMTIGKPEAAAAVNRHKDDDGHKDARNMLSCI
jgi:hypothetical protein